MGDVAAVIAAVAVAASMAAELHALHGDAHVYTCAQVWPADAASRRQPVVVVPDVRRCAARDEEQRKTPVFHRRRRARAALGALPALAPGKRRSKRQGAVFRVPSQSKKIERKN